MKNERAYRTAGIILSGLLFLGLSYLICGNINWIVEVHAEDVRIQERANQDEAKTVSPYDTASPSPTSESSPTADSSVPAPLASAQPTETPTPSPQPSDPIPSPSPDPSESPTPPIPTATPEPDDYPARIKWFWNADTNLSKQLNNDISNIAYNGGLTGRSDADILVQEGTLMHQGAERMRGNLDLVRRLMPPPDLRNWHEKMCVDYDQVASALDAAGNGADGKDVSSFVAGSNKVTATQARWKDECSDLLKSAGYDAEVFETSHRLTKAQ